MPSTSLRAERRHHRDRLKRSRTRLWYELGYDRNVAERDAFPPPKDIAVRHPFDCGNPRCGLCHSEKREPGRRRQQGKRVLAREVAVS